MVKTQHFHCEGPRTEMPQATWCAQKRKKKGEEVKLGIRSLMGNQCSTPRVSQGQPCGEDLVLGSGECWGQERKVVSSEHPSQARNLLGILLIDEPRLPAPKENGLGPLGRSGTGRERTDGEAEGKSARKRTRKRVGVNEGRKGERSLQVFEKPCSCGLRKNSAGPLFEKCCEQ